MSASEIHLLEEEIGELKHLLSELYQILGQFQDEVPEIVLDKIIAHIEGDFNGKWEDEFPDLLPWYRKGV